MRHAHTRKFAYTENRKKLVTWSCSFQLHQITLRSAGQLLLTEPFQKHPAEGCSVNLCPPANEPSCSCGKGCGNNLAGNHHVMRHLRQCEHANRAQSHSTRTNDQIFSGISPVPPQTQTTPPRTTPAWFLLSLQSARTHAPQHGARHCRR